MRRKAQQMSDKVSSRSGLCRTFGKWNCLFFNVVLILIFSTQESLQTYKFDLYILGLVVLFFYYFVICCII